MTITERMVVISVGLSCILLGIALYITPHIRIG